MLGAMTVTFIYSLRFEFFGEHQARIRQQNLERLRRYRHYSTAASGRSG